jgi:hypothetical protein
LNSSIKEAYIAKNNIGSEGAQAIAEALMINSYLRILDLSDNCIHKKGAKYLAKALQYNDSLRELNIKGNSIRKNDLESLESLVKDGAIRWKYQRNVCIFAYLFKNQTASRLRFDKSIMNYYIYALYDFE